MLSLYRPVRLQVLIHNEKVNTTDLEIISAKYSEADFYWPNIRFFFASLGLLLNEHLSEKKRAIEISTIHNFMLLLQ